MAQALPPEFNECVDLLVTLDSLYTLAPLAVVLVYQHFYKTTDVWYAS